MIRLPFRYPVKVWNSFWVDAPGSQAKLKSQTVLIVLHQGCVVMKQTRTDPVRTGASALAWSVTIFLIGFIAFIQLPAPNILSAAEWVREAGLHIAPATYLVIFSRLLFQSTLNVILPIFTSLC